MKILVVAMTTAVVMAGCGGNPGPEPEAEPLPFTAVVRDPQIAGLSEIRFTLEITNNGPTEARASCSVVGLTEADDEIAFGEWKTRAPVRPGRLIEQRVTIDTERGRARDVKHLRVERCVKT